MRRASYVTALLATALAACASGSGGGGTSGGDRNLITAEELAANPVDNAYDAVQRLRPSWLRSRAGEPPVAVIDGQTRGDIQTLRNYGTSTITSIRYLSPADATMAFGTGFPAGAIEVRTR
jgi:hypothetical protein